MPQNIVSTNLTAAQVDQLFVSKTILQQTMSQLYKFKSYVIMKKNHYLTSCERLLVNSCGLAELAVSIIGCMSRSSNQRQVFLSTKSIIAQIFGTMMKLPFSQTKQIHEKCLVTLYSMSKHAENALKLGRLGRTAILNQTILANKSNPTLQRKAFGIIFQSSI